MSATITPTPQIFADFNAYITRCGGSPSEWYVGIAKDARERLFVDHKVDINGAWIYHLASNHQAARDIEIAYHEAGYRGSHGGGDHRTVFVYAYRITRLTVE